MNNILEELSSCGLLCAALVVRMAEGLLAMLMHTSSYNIAQALLVIAVPHFTFTSLSIRLPELHGLENLGRSQ